MYENFYAVFHSLDHEAVPLSSIMAVVTANLMSRRKFDQVPGSETHAIDADKQLPENGYTCSCVFRRRCFERCSRASSKDA